jgi:hypothetical protein
MLRSHEAETPHPDQLGGTTGQRGESTENRLHQALSRYGTAKAHTRKLMQALGKERTAQLGLRWDRITECGDWMRFRHYFRRDLLKLASSNFCKKHLVCGVCAIRRGARSLAVYLERVETIPGFGVDVVPLLVTTTVRNGPDLSERLAHLLKHFRHLLKRRHLARGSVMDGVLGGVYSTEVTNTGNGWHPHIHGIWLVRRDQVMLTPDLRAEWEALTGDSFECDVQPICPRHDLGDDVSPYAAGFAEVFKYATKPAELGAELFAEAYPQLRGKRLLASFGCLRGVKVPKDLADDLTALENEPYVEFFARWLGESYSVRC